MKFKATLEDPKALLAVLQVCRSIKGECVMRLQASRVRFFTTVEVMDGMQVWVGCRTDHLFTNFRCDSHYKEQSITCEVLKIRQFCHGVRQADISGRQGGKASQTLIRLTREGTQPILKLTSQAAQGQLDLIYDVPVRILSDQEIEAMSAPPLEDDHMHVVVPNLLELDTFIDKLRSTSCDSVSFSAKSIPGPATAGEAARLSAGAKRGRGSELATSPSAMLVIHAENFLASFSLKYNSVQLIPRRTGNAEADEEDVVDELTSSVELQSSTVTVEMKTFARFFAAVKGVVPTRVSMYLVDQRALVVSVNAPGGTTMVAYIPAKT